MGEVSAQSSESPEFLRISLAAAMTLGMKTGSFYRNARLECINLLMTYGEGCAANCAYCGLQRARQGTYDKKSFIRVDWPVVSLEEIISRSKTNPQVKRICLSMITNGKAVKDSEIILQRLHQELPGIPLSLLCTPTLLRREHLERYRAIPVDRLGIAVDGATPEIFDKFRGKGVRGPHRWEKYWELFQEALEIFGQDHVGIHLIVGLGETEEQMIRLMDRIRKQGGSTHLFSFFPEPGSQLKEHPQPPAGQYRRCQLARYLIDQDLAEARDFSFNEKGQIVSFGLSPVELERVIASGLPFMTSGCPGPDGKAVCTRPYGDCAPGEDIRSFPFQPEPEDLALIRRQLWQY
ncbi:MAG: radical SAM protein [Desulfobacterota bacterium U4-17]